MTKKRSLKNLFVGLFLIFFVGIITFVIIDLIEPIKEAIKIKNLQPVSERFIEYGIWKYLFVIFVQAVLLAMAILPTELIQIIAGFSCGILFGFLCCMAGIFLGNIIIYLIVRKVGNYLDKDKDIKIEQNENKSKSFWFALSFYFIPGISYGTSAIYAAKTKMSFLKYILLTTIGAIPAALISTLLGDVALNTKFLSFTILFSFYCIVLMICFSFKKQIAKHLLIRSIRATLIWFVLFLADFLVSIGFAVQKNYVGLFISIGIFLLLIILYALLNKPVSKIFERMTRKYDMKYFQGPVKKPSRFLYRFFAPLLKRLFFKKYNVSYNKDNMPEIKKPTIVLFNHPSKFDFIYTLYPLYPERVNMMVAYYYFCNYKLGRLLKNLGCFPKYLYQPDLSAIKNAMRVMKNNGILGIAPEGRLAAYGCLEKIIPSTAKLVKSFKAQVIFAHINGAYLSSPKWAKASRKGKIEITFEELLTPEQIHNMSVDEIYNVLNKACDYDDFEWQQEHHVEYKCKKMAEGLEDILYICPVCKKEFTYHSHKDIMTCSCCQTQVKLDPYYNFISDNPNIPKNIKEWYLWQKEVEKENTKDNDYAFTSPVTLKFPDSKGRGFKVVGTGHTTLTHKGITYKGSINNEEKEIFFDIKNLPAILFGVREDFEIYSDNTLYYFVPDNLRECVKWSTTTEQIFKKYLEDNGLREEDFVS